MRLIFVRHGEPDYEHDCLTENGKVQAKDTAERLAKEKLSAIYSSPMGRAKETASYTAEGRGLEIQILDYMHEINWGSKEGKPQIEYDGHPWLLGFKLLTEEPEYINNPDFINHPYFKDNICMDYYKKISSEVLVTEDIIHTNRYGLWCCKFNRKSNTPIELISDGDAIKYQG